MNFSNIDGILAQIEEQHLYEVETIKDSLQQEYMNKLATIEVDNFCMFLVEILAVEISKNYYCKYDVLIFVLLIIY